MSRLAVWHTGGFLTNAPNPIPLNLRGRGWGYLLRRCDAGTNSEPRILCVVICSCCQYRRPSCEDRGLNPQILLCALSYCPQQSQMPRCGSFQWPAACRGLSLTSPGILETHERHASTARDTSTKRCLG